MLVNLWMPFFPVYATPTPIPTPSSASTPVQSPSPVTYTLTIGKNIATSECGSCQYRIYIDGPIGEGTYVGDVPTSISLTEGYHEIFFYESINYSGGGLFFWHWENGATETYPRSINIHENTTWTMNMCLVPCLGAEWADVCINEIGWMGTAANSTHQWVELYNAGDMPIGLVSIRLNGNSMNIYFGNGWMDNPYDRNVIPPYSYFLIESYENCVSDIAGDLVTSELLITAEGDCLSLNSHDLMLDEIDCLGGWYAGDQNYYYSMERKYPHAGYGNETNNWADWSGSTWSGRDANGDPLNATTKSLNTVYSPNWPPTPMHTPTLTPTLSPTPTFYPSHLILDSGDYNGDGSADIAVFRGSTGLWAIRNITRCYYGKEGDIPVSANYNGQGSTEIAVYRDGIGLWAIRSITRYYFGRGGDMPIPRDYSGDGQPDIAIYRGGLWAIRGLSRVYYGTGNDLPIPGDYDGDGTTDIAILRESNGLWAIRNKSRIYFGRSGDIPVPGDYSGDGIWQVGIFRPATGLWAIRGVTRIYFGIGGDWPVPGDYRGDGNDLPGIFRPSTGLWAIRGFSRLYFGKDGDTPVTR